MITTTDLYPGKKWPIWLMRQAGRILPEYRALRASAPDFWALCSQTEKIVEITQQPLRTLGVDAAIFFCDILVPLACFPDISVGFIQKSQPKIRTKLDWQQLAVARSLDFETSIPFVQESIKQLRMVLAQPLIAFAGTPWTTSLYIHPQHSAWSTQDAAIQALSQAEQFQCWIDRLTDHFADYLLAQRRAGAQQLMLFDSWALLCPPQERERFIIEPIRKICARIKESDPCCPIIYYGRGVTEDLLPDLRDCIDVFAVSSDADISELQKKYQGVLFQGNLPAEMLLLPMDQIKQITANWFSRLRDPVIVNLGSGLLPETPLAHVQHFIQTIRQLSTT